MIQSVRPSNEAPVVKDLIPTILMPTNKEKSDSPDENSISSSSITPVITVVDKESSPDVTHAIGKLEDELYAATKTTCINGEKNGKMFELQPLAESSPQQAAPDLQGGTSKRASFVAKARFPNNLPRLLNLVLGQDGKAYSIQDGRGNPYVVPVGSKHLGNIIRGYAQEEGVNLRQNDLREINAMLQAHAEISGAHRDVWYRVAPMEEGIEIDLGDETHSHIKITAGNVKVVTSGSSNLFYRTPMSLPMVMPSETGGLGRLRKYLNMHPIAEMLLKAWISYILAHPKMPTSKYPILVLSGGQGSGKSSLCNNILLKLIDPSRAGLQLLPNTEKDLAIAAQNSHVLLYDNVRGFSQKMADIFCIAATGGTLSSRQLYTDADQQLLSLHVALVLNGIHSFIDQPDLAQRCLPIHLKKIHEEQRRSDGELTREFQEDLPFILRGIFDLIAKIFVYLPEAQPLYPERMIDFVKWLAAMEMAEEMPEGIYQLEYSEALRKGQLDSLQENELATAILDLVEVTPNWTGTPLELLNELNKHASNRTQRSRDWPANAISLSKRLTVLVVGLQSQGIEIEFGRGKSRRITINYNE